MPWRRQKPSTSGGSASGKGLPSGFSNKSSRSKLQLDGSRFQPTFPSHQRGLSESHQRLRRGLQEQNGEHKADGQVNHKKGAADDDGGRHHYLGSGHQRNDDDDDGSHHGDDSEDDDSDSDDDDGDDSDGKKSGRGGSSKSASHGSGYGIESGNGGAPNNGGNDGNGSDNSSNPDPQTSDNSSNDGGSATGGGNAASSTTGSSSVGIAETTPGPATSESTSQSLQSSSVLSQSSSVASESQSSSSLSSITSDIVPTSTSADLVSVTANSTELTITSSSSSSSTPVRVVVSSPTFTVPSTISASSTFITPLSTVTSAPIAVTSLAPTPTAVPISPSNPSSPSSDISRTSFVPIIGGIVGAVVAVSAVLLVILFCLRRRRQRHCAKVDSGFAPYNSFKDEKAPSSQNGDAPSQILPPPMMRIFHRVSSLLIRPRPFARPVESRAQTPIHNPFAETTSFASSRVSWLSYVSVHPTLQGGTGVIEETMRSNPFDDPVDPSANTHTLSSPLERVSSLLPGTTISERRRSTPLVSSPPENRLSMTASAELSPQEDPNRFSSWTDRKTMSRHSAMKDSPLQKLSLELHPVDVGSSNNAGTYLTGPPR